MVCRISRKKEDLDAFVSIFGGVEDMKNSYPKTYNAYENTCKKLMKMTEAELAEANRKRGLPEEVDVEVSHISYVDETKQHVIVELRAVAEDKHGYCILYAASPRMLEAGSELDRNAVADDVCSDFTGNDEEVSLVFPAAYFLEGQNNGGVEIIANIFMIDEEVIAYKYRDLLDPYGLDYTSKFTIEHPKRTHTNQEDKKINIDYNMYRCADSTMTDYFYPFTKILDRYLRIPSKGAIEVTGVNLHSIDYVSLRASNAAGESILHNSASTGVTLDSNQKITWNIEDNFGPYYSKILNTYYCDVTYTLEIKATSQRESYSFVVTNAHSDQEDKQALNVHKIPQINIYKDCFETGTYMAMHDGSEKRVDDIKEGDMLWTPDGTRKVTDIQKARIKMATTYIKGGNGKEVSVSIDHPLVTEDGLVCASLLKKGSRVITRDGVVEVVEQRVMPEAETELYHVVLESGGRLYANGFLAGDSAAQLNEGEKRNNLFLKVSADWRTDYTSWERRTALYSQRL